MGMALTMRPAERQLTARLEENTENMGPTRCGDAPSLSVTSAGRYAYSTPNMISAMSMRAPYRLSSVREETSVRTLDRYLPREGADDAS